MRYQFPAFLIKHAFNHCGKKNDLISSSLPFLFNAPWCVSYRFIIAFSSPAYNNPILDQLFYVSCLLKKIPMFSTESIEMELELSTVELLPPPPLINTVRVVAEDLSSLEISPYRCC